LFLSQQLAAARKSDPDVGMQEPDEDFINLLASYLTTDAIIRILLFGATQNRPYVGQIDSSRGYSERIWPHQLWDRPAGFMAWARRFQGTAS